MEGQRVTAWGGGAAPAGGSPPSSLGLAGVGGRPSQRWVQGGLPGLVTLPPAAQAPCVRMSLASATPTLTDDQDGQGLDQITQK